jgi:hypothetical protein
MTESQRIVKWNEDRNLIKTPEEMDITTEMSFIIEEVIECLTDMKSDEANAAAKQIAKVISYGKLKHVIDFIDKNALDKGTPAYDITSHQIVDACSDMKVFATGTTRKAGYDPDIAMEETQKEIDSRVGCIIDGKFVKDKSPQAKANWYTADYSKAKIS